MEEIFVDTSLIVRYLFKEKVRFSIEQCNLSEKTAVDQFVVN